METIVRIRPSVSDLASAGRTIRVAEIELGGVPRGAVIVLWDRGRLDLSAEEIMNGLAEHGYESIAAELLPTDGQAHSDRDLTRDVAAILGRLSVRGWNPEQVGVLGYGFGGRVALLAATEFALGASISVNPTGIGHSATEGLAPLLEELSPALTPWVGMFGEREDATPGKDVRQLDRALWATSPAYTETVTYPGVTGDFYRNSTAAVAHAAAYDSWQRVMEWLNGHVAPRPTPLAEAWRIHQLVG
jgi:carboxymethylenebutenolidase